MAIDEALLSCFDPAAAAPILRLYGWAPPALSLGRFQDAAELLDLDRCAAENIPLVRRITGGGTIYHADELTYSIVCSPVHLQGASSIKDAFRLLTAFLLRFYRQLGLSCSYAVDHYPTGSRFGERTPLCFAGLESYDILIDGRKIGGNAQRRLKQVIFQHGSIPLIDRSRDGAGYLRRQCPADLAVCCLEDCGISIDVVRLNSLLAESFAEAMGAELVPAALSSAEEAAAGRLAAKYRSSEWNIEGVARNMGEEEKH